MLQVKRIYDEPALSDGVRVLVDRLWPRGISKEKAAIDMWLKEVAPSSDLRKWFNHEPERLEEFSHRYMKELSVNSAVPTLKKLLAEDKNVTLLYAAKNSNTNHAIVLKSFLEED